MKRGHWFVLAALLFLGWQAWQRASVGTPSAGTPSDSTPSIGTPSDSTPSAARTPGGSPSVERPQRADGLPREVADTLQRIQRGGPYPYDRDGAVFGNFERRLPERPRGWYHEYTVPTPGAHNRGARRIIAGGRPPAEFWYTGDHYESFRRLDPGTLP